MAPAPLYLDSQHIYRAPSLDQFPWLEHGFATRDTNGWPDPARLAMLHQVHSAVVVPAHSAGYLGDGDALVSSEPNLLIGVRTADCVPILLADARNRAVAAVHAGWRGTASRIVECAIVELRRRFGTVPEALHAAIGPCIGACCYEVGPDVAQRFAPWRAELKGINRPEKIDLADVNRQQLLGAGIPDRQISSGAPCTRCTPELHSFRRDKEAAGRMVSAIGVR